MVKYRKKYSPIIKMRAVVNSCLLSLFFLILFASCSSPSITLGQIEVGDIYLLDMKGEVSLKRNGWKNFSKIEGFSAVRAGDLVRMEKNSSLTIVCEDFTKTVKQVSSSIFGVSNYCDTSLAPAQIDPTSEVDPELLRARGSQAKIPYIINPRATYVRDYNFNISWNGIGDDISYKVDVFDINNKKIWSDNNLHNNFVAFDGEKLLSPGTSYSIVVSASNHTSSLDEDLPSLQFKTLSSQMTEEIKEYEDTISQLDISNLGKQYLLMVIYERYGLNDEAINVLTNMSKVSKSPLILNLLGETYMRVSLVDEAETFYLAALEYVSKDDELIELTASVCANLYVLYDAKGDKEQTDEFEKCVLKQYNKLR